MTLGTLALLAGMRLLLALVMLLLAPTAVMLVLSATAVAQDLGSVPSGWLPVGAAPSTEPAAAPRLPEEVEFAEARGRDAAFTGLPDAGRLELRGLLREVSDLRSAGVASTLLGIGGLVVGAFSTAAYVGSCQTSWSFATLPVTTCQAEWLIATSLGFGLGALGMIIGVSLFSADGRRERRAADILDLKVTPQQGGVALSLSGTFG